MKIDLEKEIATALAYSEYSQNNCLEKMAELRAKEGDISGWEMYMKTTLYLYVDDMIQNTLSMNINLDFTFDTLCALPVSLKTMLEDYQEKEDVTERVSPLKMFGAYMTVFMMHHLDCNPVLLPNREIDQRYLKKKYKIKYRHKPEHLKYLEKLQQAFEYVCYMDGDVAWGVEVPNGSTYDPFFLAWYTLGDMGSFMHKEPFELDFYMWIKIFQHEFDIDLTKYGFYSKSLQDELGE